VFVLFLRMHAKRFDRVRIPHRPPTFPKEFELSSVSGNDVGEWLGPVLRAPTAATTLSYSAKNGGHPSSVALMPSADTSAALLPRVDGVTHATSAKEFMAPKRVQCWRSKLSMNRSSESGRGLPHSKTQARATCFRASARSWTAPVLWRFGFRCKNGFMVPMRVQSWRSKLSLNRNAAQVFQPAGSGDFPVAQSDCGQESPLNPQSGKTALQTGSRARIGDFS